MESTRHWYVVLGEPVFPAASLALTEKVWAPWPTVYVIPLEQADGVTPSRLQRNDAPDSPVHVNVADVVVDQAGRAVGPEVTFGAGGDVVSITQVYEAAVLVLPSLVLRARTWNVWLPGASTPVA